METATPYLCPFVPAPAEPPAIIWPQIIFDPSPEIPIAQLDWLPVIVLPVSLPEGSSGTCVIDPYPLPGTPVSDPGSADVVRAGPGSALVASAWLGSANVSRVGPGSATAILLSTEA